MSSRIVLDFDVSEALPMQNESAITHRFRGLQGSIDIQTYVVEVISIDSIATGLPRINREDGIALGRKIPAYGPRGWRREIVSTSVHRNNHGCGGG